MNQQLQPDDFATIAALARQHRFPIPGAETRIFRGRERVRVRDTEIRRTAEEWIRRDRAPRPGEPPDEGGRWSEAQTEPAASRTEWNRRGRKVRPGAAPAGECGGRVGDRYRVWDVYRESDTIPKQVRRIAPPKRLDDVLLSIFTMNRSAKRWRDAARTYYEAGMHGFAQSSRWKKEEAYRLKDRGILYAIAHELLRFEGMHGGFGLWAGGGYRFHARFVPLDTVVDGSERGTFVVDAKPRTSREPRVMDAKETLRALPEYTPAELGLKEIPPERPYESRRYDEWDEEDLEALEEELEALKEETMEPPVVGP